jgi:hypothetical protein
VKAEEWPALLEVLRLSKVERPERRSPSGFILVLFTGCTLLAVENVGLRRIEVSGMIDTKEKRPAPNDRSA